jgi:hypothetical protein
MDMIAGDHVIQHRKTEALFGFKYPFITFAEIVGQENVIAGTDCGLGGRIHPQIAWAKLRDGAWRSRVRSCGVGFKSACAG